MTEKRKIRITHPEVLRAGFHTKVYLDDVDVSANVSEVEIIIKPDRLPIVKLTVIDVEIDISSEDPELEQWGLYPSDDDETQ